MPLHGTRKKNKNRPRAREKAGLTDRLGSAAGKHLF